MKLMIVDGNSIVNRAFFGIRPLTAPDGTPTNAIYGFLNILYRLEKSYSPDALCVSFDVHAPTFRHKACDFYKATRKPMPEDLCTQMPILKEILMKMGISVLEMEGYEADDILGTVSRMCEENCWECIPVTGDRDSLQLVSEYTHVCLVKTNEDILYSPELFMAEYGFSPKKLIDLKALQGDSSDNIPGVPGIGEKTAKDLISRYGSVSEIYSDLSALDLKDSVLKKLSAGEESAKKSYWLATIFREVPLNISLADLVWNKAYQPGLYERLYNLGLNRTINQWKIEKLSSAPDFETVDSEEIPDGVTVTSNAKALVKNGYEGDFFDTTIAQYLINPTAKEYLDNCSYAKLHKKLEELNLSKLYYELELPLVRVLADMESEGILVNREALTAFGEELFEKIQALEQSIYFHAGREFNINSPKQLSAVLFDELQLPNPKKGSTAAEVLESVAVYHPIIDDILEYREYSKLKSTYTDGLSDFIAEDGRIHTTFQQTVTATGRLSSTEPNLQNIPIRKELGSRLREMFVSAPGKILVDADYSQIELRILAHISNDENMIQAFLSGEDFHRLTASGMFNVPLDAVTPLMRSRAKAINFGIIYGMSQYTLAKDLRISNREAGQYMTTYFEKYPGVSAYMKNIVEQAMEEGFVTSLFGRRRDIPELKSTNFNMREFGKRVALNTPVQGTAADIIKLAMIKVHDALKGTSAKLILQVHDELIVECEESEKDQIAEILKNCMEEAVQLKVPLEVEVGFGRNWSEAH